MNKIDYELELKERCKRINQLEISIITVLNGIDNGNIKDINIIYAILMEGMQNV